MGSVGLSFEIGHLFPKLVVVNSNLVTIFTQVHGSCIHNRSFDSDFYKFNTHMACDQVVHRLNCFTESLQDKFVRIEIKNTSKTLKHKLTDQKRHLRTYNRESQNNCNTTPHYSHDKSLSRPNTFTWSEPEWFLVINQCIRPIVFLAMLNHRVCILLSYHAFCTSGVSISYMRQVKSVAGRHEDVIRFLFFLRTLLSLLALESNKR